MATVKELLQEFAGAINLEIDGIVLDLETLKEDVVNNTITPEEIQSTLGTIVTRLQNLNAAQ